ncbi:copper chaperone PCu(A)C [Rickettsia canadensis]|uniref:Copper(I)-binding protein n=1 Tax=Rickettsia canadensis str. CA410 TaxID=1105107 RepID=A0ABN4AGH8_RICCA|nr:copper chaperone PCu(A)C [Rickettsia canadensis]AFB20960.1 copper(I)-binding protein [Rickettsia canadensis str. CA410]
MLKTLLISLITLICAVSYAENQTAQNHYSTNASSDESNNLLPAALAVHFVQPWARPTTDVQGKVSNSAMYFTLVNSRSSSYNLVNISSDIANKIELHQTITDESGISKMVKVDYPFLIADNIKVDFKPGGMHIMLYDLKGPLNVGSSFKITFFFDDNTRKTVDVKVANDNPYNTAGN